MVQYSRVQVATHLASLSNISGSAPKFAIILIIIDLLGMDLGFCNYESILHAVLRTVSIYVCTSIVDVNNYKLCS